MEKSKKTESRGQPARGRQPVWIGALLLCGICVALNQGDTVTNMGIRDVLFGGSLGSDGILLIGVPAIFGFSLQFWLLRRKPASFTAWFPLLLSAVCLAAAEALYLSGGFSERIVSYEIWYAAFFGLFGMAAAILTELFLRQNGVFRLAAGGAAALLVILALWFWPKALGGKIDITPDNEYVWYFKGEAPEKMTVRREREELTLDLRHLKVIPAYAGPENLPYDCKWIRISDEYVLVAKGRGASYIYQYPGTMEAFDGSGLKWRTSAESAIYSSIY